VLSMKAQLAMIWMETIYLEVVIQVQIVNLFVQWIREGIEHVVVAMKIVK
jgi:hypothetical protein